MHYSISMGQVFCRLCDKMVDEAAHVLKIKKGLIHQVRNDAGNPLSPTDTTIGNKFWTAGV